MEFRSESQHIASNILLTGPQIFSFSKNAVTSPELATWDGLKHQIIEDRRVNSHPARGS